MIREKKLERRRQRKKAVEHPQQDQEAEMMTSPSSTSDDQLQKPFGSAAAKQHTPAAEVDHTRRRRRRRRPKQSPADDENSEKYENGWAVTRSESEHVVGALNNIDLMASRSEPVALHQDAASLTPHPAVNSGVSTPLDNRDLVVQPAFLQKVSNGLDVESKPYYQPHPSKVWLFQLLCELHSFCVVYTVVENC